MTSIAFASLFLGLVLGTNTVGVVVEGPVAAVEFQLDGRRIARIEKAPWSARVDLGTELSPHELIARALDRGENEIARARQWLNLPRRPLEIEILLERDSGGRPVSARLAWESILGSSASKVAVTFDGKALRVDESGRVQLPSYDRERTHLLSAAVEVSEGVSSRSDLVLGGGSEDEAKSELTAVVVKLGRRESLPDVSSMQDWFVKNGRSLLVVAVEDGSARVLIVRDRDAREAAGVLGAGGARSDERLWRYDMCLPRKDRVRFIWPVAKRYWGERLSSDLFDGSHDFTARDGGVFWLLTHVYHPQPRVPGVRFADATATAGLEAVASSTRRAVVLVLGLEADASSLSPEAVRRYLEKVRVPLFVWALVDPPSRPDLTRWGAVEDIRTVARLRKAFRALEENLESQRIVWIEGKHLPQEIALSEKAVGIELVD